MKPELERNLGTQPIENIMKKHNLKPHDLVAASTDQITHKMVARATKGRRLTPNVQQKILRALNSTVEVEYSLKDLFNYQRSLD